MRILCELCGLCGKLCAKGENMDTSNIARCEAIPVFVMVIAALSLFVGLILTIAIIWIYCKIFAKAGYCWALGLLMMVPIVNIIMLCLLAMGDWPVLRELRQLKQSETSKPIES